MGQKLRGLTSLTFLGVQSAGVGQKLRGLTSLKLLGVQSVGVGQKLRGLVAVVSQAAVLAGDAIGKLVGLDGLALVVVVDAEAPGFTGTPGTHM